MQTREAIEESTNEGPRLRPRTATRGMSPSLMILLVSLTATAISIAAFFAMMLAAVVT